MIEQKSLLKYILLTFVTCGIYGIYYMYVFTEDMNTLCDNDGQQSPNYIIVLLLSIVTCGFYYYYWLYQQGNRLHQIAPRYGMNFAENGTTILMWNIFGALICGIGPFIALNILFNNMNACANVYNYDNRYDN